MSLRKNKTREVKKNYWSTKLRGLVKKIRSNCFGCIRFQITAFANPPPGALDRTVANRAFQVIRVDYAGPLCYRISPIKERKTYILLFSCSLTGAICNR